MKVAVLGLALAFLSLFPVVSQAQNWTGNLNFFIGAKVLDEDDWSPIEEQTEFGILLDFKKDHWPVSIAIDVLHSWDDAFVHDPFTGSSFKFEGNTTEINLGLRKIWDHFPIIRPYIGGGLAIINAEAKGSVLGIRVSDDDTSSGIWLNGGIYWTLANVFNVGLDFRYSKAEVTVFDVDVEAGGGHAGLILGYHW